MTYEKTPEHLAKIATSLRGRKQSPESIAKRTATRKTQGTLRKHGHGSNKDGRSPTYIAWGGMVQRCTNPNATAWIHYGGRGITVCDRWLRFENFLADMGERPDGMTLDRIDNNGDYESGNCRWVDWGTQVQNRRRPAYYDRPSRTPDCHPGRPHKARGMCDNCYQRWKRRRCA